MTIETIARIFRVEIDIDPNSNLMKGIFCHYYEYLPDPENPGQVFKDQNGNPIPLGGYKTLEFDSSSRDIFPSLLNSQQEIGIAFVQKIEEIKNPP